MLRKLFYIVVLLLVVAHFGDDGVPDRQSEVQGETSTASLVEPEKARIVFSDPLFVTGSGVYVRSGPSTQFDAIGSLNLGASVTGGEEEFSWTRIRLPDGRVGWMASRYLSREKPTPTAVVSSPSSTQRQRAIAAPTSQQITRARNEIIAQSIANYPGKCPCPYHQDGAGRSCGKRSAWSKPGGYSPICYASDISDRRLRSYMARNGMLVSN